MSKSIINGIDVSESVLTATNNDVYYSQKAVDELQNNIKRLQEENKKLKNKNNDLIEEIASGNIDIAILQKENEKLKEKNKSIAKDYVGVFGDYQKYKQALEEIRDYANTLYNEPLMDGSKLRLRSGMYRIKSKINEVLK